MRSATRLGFALEEFEFTRLLVDLHLELLDALHHLLEVRLALRLLLVQLLNLLAEGALVVLVLLDLLHNFGALRLQTLQQLLARLATFQLSKTLFHLARVLLR